jgi:formiminoglutamase
MTGRTDPEDGKNARRMHHLINGSGERAIIGFACEAGVLRNKGRPGAKEAPSAIRNALANIAAPAQATFITDLGDISVDGDDLEAGQSMLSKHIEQALPKHDRVIVFGGGHETAYGSYLGLRAAYPSAKIGIINLDAHLDLRNISENGPSSGTPFNQIRELDPKGFDYLCLGVAGEANTQALFRRAKDWGVNIVTDRELQNDATAATANITAITKRNDILYLTIDTDLLPHYQAPGVSAPAPRGVPLPVVENIIDTVLYACRENSCSMRLADIVEVSPANDIDGMTAKTAALLARKLLS